MGATRRRRRSRARHARTQETVPPDARAGWNLSGGRHSFDRVSGKYPIHPGDRHQSRSHSTPAFRSCNRQGDADDAATGDLMRAQASAPAQGAVSRPLGPGDLQAMLGDGQELALLDVREELIFSLAHLLWARSVPLSRLELVVAR